MGPDSIVFSYQSLYAAFQWLPTLRPWLETLPAQVETALAADAHGKMPDWRAALAALPVLEPSSIDLHNAVRVGTAADIDSATRARLERALRRLHPWRKGPFDIYGLHIDTEWRSDWKWERLADQIAPLAGRTVLDVGCGNGYHCWRMAGAGAQLVVGVDPFLVYVMQYGALRHFLAEPAVYVLPLGIEDLPAKTHAFDTVFSMGVLYHRRSPFDHLFELRDALRSGGELVLETLVIEGEVGDVLVPEGRYAKMRNVWFIPSCLTLEAWLRKCGFKAVRLTDVSPTTIAEQRSTEWMRFHSLPNFLDPADATRTIEGHPAPIRAIFLAQAP